VKKAMNLKIIWMLCCFAGTSREDCFAYKYDEMERRDAGAITDYFISDHRNVEKMGHD